MAKKLIPKSDGSRSRWARDDEHRLPAFVRHVADFCFFTNYTYTVYVGMGTVGPAMRKYLI
jgi:hypothetical protein